MRELILFGSFGCALLFAFRVFTTGPKRLLWPTTLLFLLGANEAYTDFIWEKHVVAPIRVDLFISPFIMAAFLLWGAIVVRKNRQTNKILR